MPEIVGLLIVLIILALLDSTSFGTLIIPVWLMLTPERIRVRRLLTYLMTVFIIYFVIGIAIMYGASIIFERFTTFFETQIFYAVLLVIGVFLFIISFRYDSKHIEARKQKHGNKEGRVLRWRNKALTNSKSGLSSLITLALVAVSVEILTMFPYIAAIGFISSSGFSLPKAIGVLAFYCMIMILPALVLMLTRFLFYKKVEPLLIRIDTWLGKHAEYAFGWMLAIVGIMLALNSLGSLGINELLDDFGIRIGAVLSCNQQAINIV